MPYLYRGERNRSKDDFSLKMYSDEVKVSFMFQTGAV